MKSLLLVLFASTLTMAQTDGPAQLPSEIAQNDLTHCYYLAVHCRTHGEIRVATKELPADECYACPICHAICYSTLLGEGGALRDLPFWDRIQDAHSFAQADRRLWLDRKARRTQA